MENKFNIIWYNELDSTNSEALRHIDDFDNLSVIAARCQSKGRGQRGNRWFSAPGENLTFSIVLKPGADGLRKISVRDYFDLNRVSSLSVVSFLSILGVEASVKWPNDIYVKNRKISGILIENSLAGEEIASSVIGIGINLNQTDFPELSNATSVKIITGNSFSVEDALELFCKEFGKTISLLGSNSLSETYEEKLFQKGRLCRYSDYIRDREFDGIIKGVTESGRLIVKEGEEERTYAFKEIGYIL